LVSKVLAIVILAIIGGFYSHKAELQQIERFEGMELGEVVAEVTTPIMKSYGEEILVFIAFGVSIVILTELVGFFIRISFFRKIDEVKVVHNHSITIEMPEMVSKAQDTVVE
jgi:hypothetical protein